MKAIFKREFRSYFNNMTGFIFISIFLCFVGIFVMMYNFFYMNSSPVYAVVSMMPILAVLTPVITTRSLLGERQSGADRLLYSLPLTSAQIVLGKYAALLAVFAIPVAFMAILPPVIVLFGEVHMLSAYLSLLDLFAFGAALLAVGMFISSVCQKTVVAVCASYGVLIVLYVLNILSAALPSGSFFTRLLSYLSMFGSTDSLMYGLFDIRALLYYISIAAVFVFLTVRSFEKKRLA